MPAEPIVHVLWHGRTLCDHSVAHGLPCEWPDGHKWVSLLSLHERQHVTCEACKAMLDDPEIRAVRRMMVAP